MFVKRLAFVLLIVAVLSSLAGTAVAQSEPQQFVVAYVEFKPANARAGGDVLQQLDARAEDSAGLIRFDVLQQIDRPNFFALFEVWSNAQTFEDFQNSAESQATQARRLVLQKLFISTPPIVSFQGQGGRERGFDSRRQIVSCDARGVAG